jgi:hypothetical protein
MSKIYNNVCFDSDLLQNEDIDFFLMSSKDNIIIELNNKFYCFKRKNLIKELSENEMLYYNSKYYPLFHFETIKFNLLITEEDFKSLNYRKYRFYSLVFHKKLKKGNVYKFEKVSIDKI